MFHFYSYLPLNVTQLCITAAETYHWYSVLTVVCFAMAGTTSSPEFSLVPEIFKSMEYGPVSNSSGIAKVCIFYLYFTGYSCIISLKLYWSIQMLGSLFLYWVNVWRIHLKNCSGNFFLGMVFEIVCHFHFFYSLNSTLPTELFESTNMCMLFTK